MLPLDDIFGVIYLSPDAFLTRAKSIGVDVAGLGADDVAPTLAIASRAVEAHTGRTFVPDSIEETHRWDQMTRRVSVNQPPVLALESFKIRFAPGELGSVVTFELSEVLVNNQENYLELAPYAPAEVVLAQIGPGVREPQVEIRYKSFQSVPGAVAAAVGFTAAHLMQEAVAGLVRSVPRLMGVDLPAPHYSTLSRRAAILEVRLPRLSKGPLHPAVDSTGIKLYGEGEWKVRLHGKAKRRTRRKLHLLIVHRTQEAVACSTSEQCVLDRRELAGLLREIEGEVAEVLYSSEGGALGHPAAEAGESQKRAGVRRQKRGRLTRARGRER